MINVRRLVLLLTLLLAACGTSTAVTDQPAEAEPTTAPEPTTEPEPTEEAACPPAPEQVTVDYAAGFTVAYEEGYKVVTVTQPFPNAAPEDAIEYVLEWCEGAAPDDAQPIRVPVEDTILMSTTYITMMDDLGLLDRVIGLDSFQFVNNEAIRERIANDDLVAISFGPDVNIEVALEADPDMIMTYSFGTPDTDSGPILEEAGLPVVINGDYVETTPLGRAEWVKFIATFYNAEAEANAVWNEIETAYSDAAERARAAQDQPTVLADVPFEGTWYAPAGDSYVAQLIADAGGGYIYADTEGQSSLFLDFETVLEDGQSADVWINIGTFETLEGLAAADERYTEFEAYQEGDVWGNNRLQTEFGNAYFESAPARPHLVLLDLVKIFHPELAEEHEFVYYQQLQ